MNTSVMQSGNMRIEQKNGKVWINGARVRLDGTYRKSASEYFLAGFSSGGLLVIGSLYFTGSLAACGLA